MLNFTARNFRSFRDLVELSFVATRPGTDGRLVVDSTHAKHGAAGGGALGCRCVGEDEPAEGAGVLSVSRRCVADRGARSGCRRQSRLRARWQAHADGREPAAAGRCARGELQVRFDGARILFERLDQWDTHRRRSVFVRDAEDAASAAWSFGRGFGSARKQIQEATRANALFLSTGAYFNHPVLKDVSAAILRGIRGASDVGLSGFPLFLAGDPLLDPSASPRRCASYGERRCGHHGLRV